MPEKEPQVENRYKPRINPQSMRNSHSNLNPIKAAISTITQTHNSVVNDFPEESSNVEESNNVETVLFEEVYTSEVLGKEQKSNVKFVSRKGVNCGSPIQGNNIKNPHVPARVSTHAKRVLPSWICRCRPATQNQKTPTTKITRKKREHVNSSDYTELLSKRLQISQNVEAASIILAETDHQPHQE